MMTRYLLFSLLACCWACNNIEDATPSERKTFIRFFEETHDIGGVSAEPVDGGYIILAREQTGLGANGVIIRADQNGKELGGERIVIPNFLPRSLKTGPQGYYVTGDRIQFNPSSENLFDLTVTSAMLYRITASGDTSSYSAYDTAKVSKTDFHGSSITINNADELILLGTFKQAKNGAFERPFILAMDPVTLDTIWSRRYDVLDRDYVNAKAVHSTGNGNIIWASALLKETGELSRSYLSIPLVKEESVFLNNDVYGETSDQDLKANDIQPSEFSDLGYGLIGTYALPTGLDANMFFIRIDKDGNFIPGSERFFDGASQGATTPTQSSSEDSGDAITSTQDGGFILAGSMFTTPLLGNGGLDILLVKVDALGNILWSKNIGGEGDESVGSIRETEDGGLLICGSNRLSGLSSIFLIKTDKNGELKD